METEGEKAKCSRGGESKRWEQRRVSGDRGEGTWKASKRSFAGRRSRRARYLALLFNCDGS